MNRREWLENGIVGLIGLIVLVMPFCYQLRMQSGIFRFDIYLWWIAGLFAWLYFFWSGKTVSKLFLGAISPFLLFVFIGAIIWKSDDGSTSFFITCFTGLGVYLFLVQTGAKISRLIWMAVVSVFIQQTFALHQSLVGYAITAYFYNSGHWGNFLAMMLPVVLLQLRKCRNYSFLQFFLGILLLVTVGFLLQSMARAAIVGVVAGIVFLIGRKLRNGWMPWLYTVGLLLLGYTTWLICFTKSASLLGRITVYRVCIEIWKDHWLAGIGPNRFAAIYNHYQADVLSMIKLPVEREILATNMVEAFNLPLQFLVEYGLAGCTLFAWMLLKWLRLLNKKEPEYPASFLVLLTASLFSNPFHVTPVSFVLLLLLAASTKPAVVVIKRTKWPGKLISAFQLILLLPYIVMQIIGERYWKKASEQALYEGFMIAQPTYKKAAKWLSYRGSFLFNYGAEACIAGKSVLAIQLLEASAQKLASNQLYVYLGDAYSNLGRNKEAEQAYLVAIAMVPAAIFPKYQLIRFYTSIGNVNAACIWSRHVLGYPVKIASPAARQLLKELRQLSTRIAIYCSG